MHLVGNYISVYDLYEVEDAHSMGRPDTLTSQFPDYCELLFFLHTFSLLRRGDNRE
jgi:hypothetical protein